MEMAQAVATRDLKYAYNDKRAPGNQISAKRQVSAFLCPSNGMNEEDPQGYGQADYSPTVGTIIDPATGLANGAKQEAGALGLGGTRISQITDGTS
ncbi:hypothetical protein, partial [Staphylococcus aureus]